jgi:hypothetical protein
MTTTPRQQPTPERFLNTINAYEQSPGMLKTYDERARRNEPYKSTPSSLSGSVRAPRTKNRTSLPNSPPFRAPSRIRVADNPVTAYPLQRVSNLDGNGW